MKHFHPFGVPRLRPPGTAPNWKPISEVGRTLQNWYLHMPFTPSCVLRSADSVHPSGLICPQFHCMFDDNFDTVKKEQADTSIWKVKAHLQEAKERAAEITTQSSLISGPQHHPATSLRPYVRDIPQALQNLSQLLPDARARTDGDHVQDFTTLPTEEPTSPVATELQDPAPDQVNRLQQDPSTTQPPVVIAPSGYTRTGCQIRRPARLAYAAYNCKHLAQTGIQSVFDFHLFASLQAFASTLAQPDGYPDAMPLNVALQQPDRDKFIHATARELEQQRNSSIGRLFTSLKCRRMTNVSPWYGLSDANGIQQVRS